MSEVVTTPMEPESIAAPLAPAAPTSATPLPEEKICIPALSPGFNQRAVVGAISEAAAFCFHLDGDDADQVETLNTLKRSACVGQIYDSYEEARQSLVLSTCKPQFDATIASLVKRCADRGDDNVTKAVSKAIRVMSEHRNVLPDEAPAQSAPTTIPRPPVTTELVEPVVLPEPGLPFNVTLKDASWFKKEHCAYVQIDTDRAALVTVFSVSDAHVITLTHAIAQCAGMTIAAGSKISIRNECGEWEVAEAGKVAVLEPSTEHWTWRIWKASCVSQKSASWKATSSTIDVLPGTVPSATVHAHQL